MTGDKFVHEALRDLALVKSETTLRGWHDLYFGNFEYLHISKEDAMKLEKAYQQKDASFLTPSTQTGD